MRSIRFSIASLMIAIAIIGGGLAALQSPTRLGMAIVFLAVISALLLAVLGAICDARPRRACWLGAGLFGGVYMMLAFTNWFDAGRYAIDAPIRELRNAFWSVRVPDGGDYSVLDGMDTDQDPNTNGTVGWPAWHTFGPIAHCLVAMLFGLAGGVAGRWFYLRSLAANRDPPRAEAD